MTRVLEAFQFGFDREKPEQQLDKEECAKELIHPEEYRAGVCIDLRWHRG